MAGNVVNGIKINPFLKWAGGKRWLAEHADELFPKNFNTYYEPFLGSGAIFFKLMPKKAVLADLNKELIATYRMVKSNSDTLEDRLSEYHESHSPETYYRVRSEQPSTDEEIAARFIYLNRTCWNGLYRVNQRGQFNVPIGSKQSVILPTDNWERSAKALKNAKLVISDFEKIIDRAQANDLVFADPPYTVKHNNNGFVKYNETIFAWHDQIRLRDALARAKARGAHVFCTNADHQSIWNLYEDAFEITKVSRSSVISGASAFRGKTTELIIR